MREAILRSANMTKQATSTVETDINSITDRQCNGALPVFVPRGDHFRFDRTGEDER
jgi:hypothetical protein